MDFGNVADWANVVATALGFLGAIFAFRDAKDSNLGIGLRDYEETTKGKSRGYEIVVTNNSDDHLILENCFDYGIDKYTKFCKDSHEISFVNKKSFSNRKIVEQHSTATLWVLPPFLLDYLAGYDKEITDTNIVKKDEIMNNRKKWRTLKFSFVDRGSDDQKGFFHFKKLRRTYVITLFLDVAPGHNHAHINYEFHSHKFRKHCKECRNTEQKISSLRDLTVASDN
ncbi:hypothetical protein [Companilactobacillus hulinensis]|uniref:hypothetical protein n=1 Tax=Companilactobacillus hulinensis TaxID=2486007 RepID=UPI000F778DD2|nr:hypothetical protein [Companilactobacillus hulinensis]